MYSKYSCSFCKTIPDQRSHHNAHLKTQKHIDKRSQFVKNMKIFSQQFRQIDLMKWEDSHEREYILEKYLETNPEPADFLNVKQWIDQQGFIEEYNYDCWDDKKNKIFNGCSTEEYYKKTGILIETNFNFKNKDEDQIQEYILYSDWAINKIVEHKETICEKPKKNNYVNDTKFRHMLSKHTNVKLNTLNLVRQGEIDLRYLFEPPLFDLSVNNNINIELYNDLAVKYACLLFENTGIWHISIVYDGYGLHDLNENPESRYNQTFYFHKQVEIVHKQMIEDVIDYNSDSHVEQKKIWVSCDMHKICDCYEEDVYSNSFKYLSNDDFKFMIKERLCTMYQNKIDDLTYQIERDTKHLPFYMKNGRLGIKVKLEDLNPGMEERLEFNKIMDSFDYKRKHYLNEKNMIRDLSLSSKLLDDIVKICEYLFEYNEELIEYYKKNKPFIYSSRNQDFEEETEN